MTNKNELCRAKFEEWWDRVFGPKSDGYWNENYVKAHDYYLQGSIDDQYDTWKSAWNARAEMEKSDD